MCSYKENYYSSKKYIYWQKSLKIVKFKIVKNINESGAKKMKSTGIVRRVDDLGRIVLPRELRKILNIDPRDSLEIFMDGDTIILRKYEPQCIFCGQANGVRTFKSKNVCENCMKEINNASIWFDK